jgi:hypothetical protein
MGTTETHFTAEIAPQLGHSKRYKTMQLVQLGFKVGTISTTGVATIAGELSGKKQQNRAPQR